MHYYCRLYANLKYILEKILIAHYLDLSKFRKKKGNFLILVKLAIGSHKNFKKARKHPISCAALLEMKLLITKMLQNFCQKVQYIKYLKMGNLKVGQFSPPVESEFVINNCVIRLDLMLYTDDYINRIYEEFSKKF